MAYIETSAHSIGDIFNEVQRDLRTVIVGPALQGLIRARDNQNRDPVSGISAVMWGDLLAERFEAMAQSYFRYSQLRYLDENGDEVVRVDYDGIQAWRVPAAELQNKADRHYFQQAMQRLPDQIYISSTDLNREAGQIQVPYQPTIRYAMPVFNKEGERRGVVVFNVMVEEVIQTDIVPPSGEGVFAFVVDSQGYYVHNVLPEKEFGGPADLNTGEGIRADFPELAHRILSGQMGEGYTTGLQIFYAPIQIAPEQGDFWVLGLAVPRVIIQAPTRQFALVFAGVLAFSLLLAISAGSLIARRISQPLEALRQGARQIAGGHFDQRVRVKGSVEITDLADDFNQMVIQLETLYSSLQTDYRYLFESANDSIFIHDLNGRILDVNENAVRRLNYTKEELLRMTLDDIDTPEAAGCTDENLRLLKERGNLVIESAHRHKDGSVIPIEVSSTLVTYLGQKVVLSFVRDIRERKRAEAEIIRLYEQLKARRIEQQAALLRLSQGLLAATERQEMMDLTVQIAAQALAVPMAALMLPEEKPDPTDMVLRAAIGGRPEQIGNFRLPIGPDSGAGYAFSTGQPIVIGDVTAERRFRPHEIAFKLGVQAGLVVPVSVSGRVIGALSVARLEPSAFDEDDLRLLSLIANQTAIALERDRLFEETRRRASELEVIAEVGSLVTAGGDLQAILDTLAHKIADSTGFDAVDIGLYDEERQELSIPVLFARHPMKLLEGRKGTVVRLEDAPVLQQILRERHHILFEDPQNDPRVRERMRALAREDGIQTVLTWPLLYAGKLIGVLDLISTQRHLFLPEDISLFSTLADQTATAVRNAQLFSETRQRLDEISLLFDLSAALRAELNMDGMLPLILEKAMVGLDADGAAVIVCDTNTNVLQVRMARGAFEGEIGQSHPLEDMPADCAMRTSGICLGQDDCPFLPDSGRPFNIACVPFRVGEQTLGGLHIGTRRENNYNERELRLLAGIADLAANALRRVALFEEVRLYKDAFASTTDGITITDLQTRIMDVNPAFEQLTGISRQEALGKKPSIVKSSHSTPEFYRKMWEQILSQGSWEGEIVNLRKNDEEWNSHLTISTVRDERGRPVAYVGINRDITARKQAEAQIQRQLQQITTLRNIDMVITASLDLRLTLNVLLDQVTSQLDIHAADILLLHPHSRMLEYTAGRGFRTTALQYTRLRLGEGLAGQAALERRTISIPDFSSRVADFPQATVRNLQTENFVAYYGVPLIAKGQVKGVLEIFHRAPLAPDPQWLEFLEALAAQASIAIDNAALFTDLQRSNVELALAYDATIEGWSHALDLRDRETEGHTQRVTEMTERLARAFGLDEAEMVHVRRGALLHDMGKMGVPDNILLKAGPLTEEEWAIMHQHPQHAYDMLHQIAYLRPALDIPYCHHERWDGSGYPQGLKGEQIPLVARIFAIVDVWDALTSDRPYRKAWSQEQAREHIRSLAGVHFDPQVVKMFMEMIEVDGEEG